MIFVIKICHFSPPPAMRSLLCLVLLSSLLAAALADNSTYVAMPFVPIAPPLPLSSDKLYLQEAELVLDLDAGRFYLTAQLTYVAQGGEHDLHPVHLTGDFYRQAPSYLLFSYDAYNSTDACREDARNSPPMCPYLMSLTSGPFVYAADPSETDTLVISTSSDTIDPVTGKLMNFLGAFIPFTWECNDTCAPLGPVPVPIPQNEVRNYVYARAYLDEQEDESDSVRYTVEFLRPPSKKKRVGPTVYTALAPPIFVDDDS